jgi:hypothetical protein
MLTMRCRESAGVSSISGGQAYISEELTEFVARTAVFIQRRGWTAPALVLLEVGTPLAFIGGQLIWLAQPLLSLVLPTANLDQAARLLETPAALETLYQQLQDDAVGRTG